MAQSSFNALADGGRLVLPARKGSGDLGKEPGIAQHTPGQHYPPTARLPQHGQGIGARPDVSVAYDGDVHRPDHLADDLPVGRAAVQLDRKSTRLNSSHVRIS